MQTFGSAEPADGHQSIDITFDPRGDRLIGLGFVNGFLKLITLGTYSFWGKTEVRRRIWSFTKFNGEPLEYTGTGKELFLGFLVVFFTFILPTLLGGFAVMYSFPGNKTAMLAYYAISYVLFFLLVGNAMYRATRYRLTRTRWRGIRGDLTGSPWHYGWTYFWTLALPAAIALGAAGLAMDPSVFSMLQVMGAVGAYAALASSGLSFAALAAGAIIIALIMPWRANALQKQMTNAMQFGSAPLTYTGGPAPLYKRYFLAGFGGLLLVAGAIAATAALTYASLPGDAEFEPQITPLTAKLAVAGIWFALIIALAVITAWYRASQFNHFARHTQLGRATFRAEAAGPGLAWLSLSNWLLVVLSTLIGVAIGVAIAFLIGVAPRPGAMQGMRAEPPVAFNIAIILPIVMMTTVAATFAQFRSARYFLSRLKLDGKLDLDTIMQNPNTGPKRGEGLAQVFDFDAF